MDAKAWDERYQASELVWGAEPNRFVRAQCEGLPVGEAVDLACGEGRNALWLARLGWHVTGLDYSPVAIARARDLTNREPANVAVRTTWRVADVVAEPLPEESVDLALISYLHLPLPDHRSVVRSAARSVRAGGHLLIVGHDRRNLTEGVGGPQDPTRLYDASELRRLITRFSDLEVDLAKTVERPTDEGVALDTLVRARRVSTSG